MRKLDRQASFANPLQLQEYYTAQSDILEELMRNNRAMQQHIHNTNNLVTQGDHSIALTCLSYVLLFSVLVL